MSGTAQQVLEQALALPPQEQRQIAERLLSAPALVRKPLSEVLGKYRPLPDAGPDDHNKWFADAIEASKRA